ncbi:hypothetical protein BGZ52_010895, partial [Haplosporangium bisporale]
AVNSFYCSNVTAAASIVSWNRGIGDIASDKVYYGYGYDYIHYDRHGFLDLRNAHDAGTSAGNSTSCSAPALAPAPAIAAAPPAGLRRSAQHTYRPTNYFAKGNQLPQQHWR